jgi:sec-independent protein translocase protein TatA
MLGGIGVQEIVIILVIGLLVFGAARLPKIARSLGQGIKEFKKTVKGIEEDDEEESGNKMKYVPHQQPAQGYAYNQGQQYYPNQQYGAQQYNPAQQNASPGQNFSDPAAGNQPGQNPQAGGAQNVAGSPQGQASQAGPGHDSGEGAQGQQDDQQKG